MTVSDVSPQKNSIFLLKNFMTLEKKRLSRFRQEVSDEEKQKRTELLIAKIMAFNESSFILTRLH